MTPIPDEDRPDRNPAPELVRVTEAAALAAARLVGMGEKEAADQAAVDAMRLVLSTVHMDGVVVLGEGGKDEGEGGRAIGALRRTPPGHDADQADRLGLGDVELEPDLRAGRHVGLGLEEQP